MKKDLIAMLQAQLANATPAELAEAKKVIGGQEKAVSDKAVGEVAKFVEGIKALVGKFPNLPAAVTAKVEKDCGRYEALAASASGPDKRPSKKDRWWAPITGFRLKDGTVVPPAPAAQVAVKALKFAPKTFSHPQHRPPTGKGVVRTDDRLWLMNHWEEFQAATGTAMVTGNLAKPKAKKAPKAKKEAPKS